MPPKKASKKSQDDRYDWLTEAPSSSSITPLHRRKAAGLTGWTPCPVHSSIDSNPTHPARQDRESTIDSNYQSKRDPNCTTKKCAKNPRCYNHLGIDQALKQTKEEYVLERLGDPPERRVDDQPAGLRNLGATCYANAFLQVWYRNISFRNGVYKAAQSAATNSPMYHLAMIFALLQFSKRAVLDPTPLIDCLGFDKARQQDATEFQKLFTEYIADTFQRQSDPAVKNVLSDLFQGELTNVTKCLKCGKQSERTQSFLEIDINLTNNATLDQCIANSFGTELLTGENKYRCTKCNSLQEAERWTVMRNLPPVLNFTLMRFKFTAGGRVKSKAKIKYSRSMLLGDAVWNLKAAVIHVGTSAHHGHFICDVYDEELGRWVSCNDELVEEPPNPAKRRKVSPGPDDNITCDQVYMLIYQQEKSKQADPPPPNIMRQVELDDADFEQDLDRRAVKRKTMEDEYLQLHGAKEHVLRSLPGDDVIVPTSELTRWIKSHKVAGLFQPFDYTPVKCQHGGLDPEKGDACHLISEDAFSRLGAYDPDIVDSQPCAVCVEEEYNRRRGKTQLADQIAAFDAANALIHDRIFHIPRTWLDLWRKGGVGNTTPSDAPYSLFCHHNSRWDKDHKTAKVTAEAYVLLGSLFGEFRSFIDTEPTCGECAEDLAGGEEVLALFNKERKEEQGWMRKCVKTPNQPVVFNEDFYLLPNGWFDGWHAWNTGGGIVSKPKLEMGICKHGKLDWDPTTEPARYTSIPGWRQITAIYGDVPPVMIRFGSDPFPPGKKNSINHIRPDICEPCRVEKAAQYETTKITIVIGTGSEAGSKDPMGRGRITRNKAKTWDTEITKSTTVKDIKIEIYNSLNVSPISQKIRYQGRVLESDETMESAGILARDILFCEIIEEDDVLPLEVGANEGFGGSILVGNISCPNCTFLQRAGAINCEVCQLPMDAKVLTDHEM